MNQTLVDKITRAVLYEGYILYPYRPSVKNRQRWTFGGLYPESFIQFQPNATQGPQADASSMQTQCLVHGTPHSMITINIRFLHLVARTVGEFLPPLPRWPTSGEPPFRPVDSLQVGERLFQTWQEATEREIVLPPVSLERLLASVQTHAFDFPFHRELEPLPLPSGEIGGVLLRQQQAVAGVMEYSAQPAAENLFKLTVRIFNRTPMSDHTRTSREEALLRSLVSTHTILGVHEGEFVSLMDPPPPWQALTSACRNLGTWPVLIGEHSEKDTLLSSPIILYDYPEIAPESPGDLFDSTEIDEILTLRILTLTDDEKRVVAAIDERARALLARTEALARDQLLGLHGTFRGLHPVAPAPSSAPPPPDPLADRRRLEQVLAAGVELKPGDHVRLRPRARADIFDLALRGRLATIAAIEQDYENRIHIAVTVDDDPGQDFGRAGQIGHRFFFQLDEVEPVPAGT